MRGGESYEKEILTALVSSASVAALALSGCGGKTSETTAAADQNSAAAESGAETAGENGAKKVLRFDRQTQARAWICRPLPVPERHPSQMR